MENSNSSTRVTEQDDEFQEVENASISRRSHKKVDVESLFSSYIDTIIRIKEV